MYICGSNHCRQLGEESDNQSTWGDGIICPPVKSHFNLPSLLSFSVYFDHTVIVKLNGQAYAIGNNKEGQISPTLPKQVLLKETEIQLKDSNGQPLKFISAVCGENYTLYQATNETSADPKVSLIFVKKNQNPLFVNINGRTPISLFGGHSTSASIDSEGAIIIINERILSSNNGKAVVKFLPSNEKAVQVACCEEFVAVLGTSGRLFTSPVANGGEMINFKEVEELSGKKIVSVSGKYMHCIAVCSDGKVFGKGSNKNSRLGINKDESVKFIEIKSLNTKKAIIVAADAGFGHSLFTASDGKIFACGSNFYGHLMLKKTSKNAVFPPAETLPFCTDPFCIAGYCISAVMNKSDVPPNTPNTKFEKRGSPIKARKSEPIIKERKSEPVFLERKSDLEIEPDKNENPDLKPEKRASKHDKNKKNGKGHHHHHRKIEKSHSAPDGSELKMNEKRASNNEKNKRFSKIMFHKTTIKDEAQNEKKESGEPEKNDTLSYEDQDNEKSDSIASLEMDDDDDDKDETLTNNTQENKTDENETNIKEKRASKNRIIKPQIHLIESSETDESDQNKNSNIKLRESPEKVKRSRTNFDSDETSDAKTNEEQATKTADSDIDSEDSEKQENEDEKPKFTIRVSPAKGDMWNFEKRASNNEKDSPRNSKNFNNSDDSSDTNDAEAQFAKKESSDSEESDKPKFRLRESPIKNDAKNIEKRASKNEKNSPKNSPRNSKVMFNSDEINDTMSNELQASKTEIAQLKSKLEQKDEEISQLKKEKDQFLKKEKAYKAKIAELEKALKKQQLESKSKKDDDKSNEDSDTDIDSDSDEEQKHKQKEKEKERPPISKQSSSGELVDKTLHVIKQIGQGHTSEVFEVYRENRKDLHFAQKVLRCSKSSIDKSDMKQFIRDCETLNASNSPNVVKVFKISIGDSNRSPSILLELCSCNLKENLKELNRAEKASVIVDISNGMKEVHKAKMIHLDLRLENILLDDDNKAKVSDFGICKLMKVDPNSTNFMAPELILKKGDYTEKVDVFSFGVLVYVIISGGNLPKIEPEDVAKGKKAAIPANFTEFSRHLINRCWAFNPSDRPSFEEICSMLDGNEHKLI